MKPVSAFENIFSVTEDGQVFSHRTNRFLKTRRSQRGYVTFSTVINGKASLQFVHKLVATAYLPNPEGKRQVNHLDGNKGNNHVSNLEWCTHSENTKHAYTIGLMRKQGGVAAANAKLTNEQVTTIRSSSLSSRKLAKQMGVAHSTILRCKSAKRYKFTGV